jgi:hypothetical protein
MNQQQKNQSTERNAKCVIFARESQEKAIFVPTNDGKLQPKMAAAFSIPRYECWFWLMFGVFFFCEEEVDARATRGIQCRFCKQFVIIHNSNRLKQEMVVDQ